MVKYIWNFFLSYRLKSFNTNRGWPFELILLKKWNQKMFGSLWSESKKNRQ